MMNLRSLSEQLAANHGISKAKASDLASDVFHAIAHELQNGGEVRIHQFGTFKQVERKARKGRNPATGESIEVPAKKAVKFSPSAALL
jgi:DNA-binding protein HU-beta